ncbi:alpha/beta hydrolase [Ruania suaedae]|uniref:alpha/beta fold hydrolase n=1 Tax=Ruania suaedae TaxID=2897774 RepID=UPI001E2F98D5|nr:alpha/beta hydrolase [Ruania suaedae]UFU03734.1 alpha/beta hydrolase [Ruania suaedae]
MSSRLAVHSWGPADRPPLVLLHGITDSGRCWADAVTRWEQHYRVIAPDALGHGDSDRFSAEELDGTQVDLMVEEIIGVLEDLADPAVLLGHSMGGATAAAVAVRRPDLVRALVLEDPAWRDLTEEQERERAQAFLGGRGEPGASWPASEIAPWRASYEQVDRDFLTLGRATPSEPWREIVTRLTMPTLIVTGTEGVIIDPAQIAEIEGLGNDLVHVEVVEGAGHCVRRDRTEAYHAVVDPWIAERLTPARP